MRAREVESLLICGVDDSQNSRSAIRVAADLARRLEARIVLLHVSEVTTPPPGAAFAYAKLQEQALATGEQLLQELCEEERLESAERQVVLGTPANVLIAAAATNSADLIVVGTRGRGALKAAVLGSVSSEVASKAPCPVVVVPSE